MFHGSHSQSQVVTWSHNRDVLKHYARGGVLRQGGLPLYLQLAAGFIFTTMKVDGGAG